MKKSKLINARISIFVITSFIFFCFGGVLMIQAEKYPVVWRYSMFMNAPNTLVVTASTLAFSIATLFFWRLSKYTKYFIYQYSQTILVFGGIFIFSFVFLISQLGLIINGTFDSSTPIIHDTVVLDKDVKRSLKYGDQYYIYFTDWTDLNATVQFLMTESAYNSMEVGDEIQVETKKGYLGYEWIVNYLQIRNNEY